MTVLLLAFIPIRLILVDVFSPVYTDLAFDVFPLRLFHAIIIACFRKKIYPLYAKKRLFLAVFLACHAIFFTELRLKKEKYHVNDLLEELRLKGVFNIADLNFAILETSGQISVQLKPEKQPVTVSDLNLSATRQGLCANLIIDGKILYQHLKLVNRDEIWLREELKKQNIEDVGQVLLASMDGSGNLYIDVKDDQVKEFNVLK